MPSSRPRIVRVRHNGQQRPLPRRTGRGAWWAVFLGALLIVGLGWLVALEPAGSQVVVASSLLFALAEGIVLAFVAALWSSRGLPYAVAAAVLTAVMATGGRWELVYMQTSRTADLPDLLLDLGFTVAYAILAGVLGATILRERLTNLLPNAKR